MQQQRSGMYSKVWVAAKLIILIATIILLYNKLKHQQDVLNIILEHIERAIFKEHLLLLLAVLMMPVNWMLEALKWQLLVKSTVKLSIREAIIGVISGLTLSFATPHAIGDYFGRLLNITVDNKPKLIGALLLGRLSQLLITIIFGCLSLFYLYQDIGLTMWGVYILIGLIIFYIMLRKTRLSIVDNYLGIIKTYSAHLIAKVLLIALVRYLVFASQFVIIIYAFFKNTPIITSFMGGAYIFLLKSVLPTFNFLSDLGIRELAAVQFFENFSLSTLPIVSASLTLWIINILIPTLTGVPFVYHLKWSNK